MPGLIWLQSLLGAGIPILCYHQVRPKSRMTPERFGRHLDLLQRMGFSTISLRQAVQIMRKRAPEQPGALVLTFDDCTLDNWVYALPELRARNMQAVFFGITDFLVPGTMRPRADQSAHPLEVPDFPTIMHQALRGDCSGFLNHAELRALVHDLNMEVYAHSAAHQACFISTRQTGLLFDNTHWSHRLLCGPQSPDATPVHPVGSAYAQAGFGLDWTGQPLTVQRPEDRLALCMDDFSSSKQRLEDILGQPCPFLCLPWGEYDSITIEAAQTVGFEGVLTLEAGYVGPGTNPMAIGRLAVTDRKTRAWLARKTVLLALRPLAGLVRGRQAQGRT
ncbi:polysaccharide deacetylase family protein [Desulfovibrionales bacterium]